MIHVSIKKRPDKSIISYALKKKDQISATEFAMASEGGEIPSILPLQKTTGLMGGTKLVFTVSDLVDLTASFKNEIHFLDFISIVRQIVQVRLECEAHGFPSVHLDMSPERIFYDYKEKKIFMLYWPLNTMEEHPDFTKAFLDIGKLYESRSVGVNRGFMEQYYAALEGRGPFDSYAFLDALKKLETDYIKASSVDDVAGNYRGICLYYKKKDTTIPIGKGQFVLGRDPQKCTYVFQDVETISRVHATIKKDIFGKYVIEDEGSTNGTFVNGIRLKEHQPCQIQNGTRIHLSVEEFFFSNPTEQGAESGGK